MPDRKQSFLASLSQKDIKLLLAKLGLSTPPAKDDTSPEDPTLMARSFLNSYVKEILKALEIDPKALNNSTKVDWDVNATIEDNIRSSWRNLAGVWAGVESSAAYYSTMLTLASFLKTDPARKETILSLGSGPGLYETYLSSVLEGSLGIQSPQFLCVDFAPEMTSVHKKIINITRTSDGKQLHSVKAVTADMTRLENLTDGSVAQIICNNSLQWVPQWQKAIAQMKRVISPDGLGYLYLVLNIKPHRVTPAQQEGPLLQLPQMKIAEILDCAEANQFAVLASRRLVSPNGQMGKVFDRLFVLGRYAQGGITHSWRTLQPKSTVSYLDNL